MPREREVPGGVKDFLPHEMGLKRQIELSALELLKGWGYREVDTPVYEYLEVVERSAGQYIREELQLLLDREGRILVLRPEMTIPIARLASTHLQDYPLPLRLTYSSNIFRHTQPQMGRYKEFWQLGVEMIGARGVRADAEVIALAALCLERMGLKDYKISVNHVRIFNQIMSALHLDIDEDESLRSLVVRKDLVGLEHKLDELNLPLPLKEELLKLPLAQGGPEIIKQFPSLMLLPRVKGAVDELLSVFRELDRLGVGERVVIDLGVLRDLDYYTGVIFEGYSPQLGFPLLGGGRYDNLMAQFGWDNPATGFAIGLERVMLCLGFPPDEQPRYLVGGSDWERTLAEAESLREQGLTVEVDVEGHSQADLIEMIKLRTGYKLVYVD
ncbi:MAG: ATP phosphoribosyltransferase regulatory subunit [Methylocystaceae bacterium]